MSALHCIQQSSISRQAPQLGHARTQPCTCISSPARGLRLLPVALFSAGGAPCTPAPLPQGPPPPPEVPVSCACVSLPPLPELPVPCSAHSRAFHVHATAPSFLIPPIPPTSYPNLLGPSHPLIPLPLSPPALLLFTEYSAPGLSPAGKTSWPTTSRRVLGAPLEHPHHVPSLGMVPGERDGCSTPNPSLGLLWQFCCST